MLIADGLAMLEISAVVMGRVTVTHPTLLWDRDTAMLVDTGVPGQLGLIRAAVEREGVPFDRVDLVILTHQDIDHIGSLPALLQESAHPVQVLASEAEKPYIEGDLRPVKLTPEAVEAAVAALPPAVPEEMRRRFRAVLENPPHAPVDRTLANGEELPYCGGIVAIETPGHTPGHLCLYHRPSKTLIAGDALTAEDGRLFGPDPQATTEMDQATRSLGALTGYDIDAVICYHGGLCRGDANRRIAELAATSAAG